MNQESFTIGVLGCGGLGAAMASGLISKGKRVVIFDRNPDKIDAVLAAATTVGGEKANSFEEMAKKADVILCAVKPHATPDAFQKLAAVVGDDTLLISCAAGVALKALEDAAPNHAVARAMPNVGAQYGLSMTAAVLSPQANLARDTQRLNAVFEALGQLRIAPNEDEIHAAIALAGSGPAYFLLALEAMEDQGVAFGLPRPVARAYSVGAIQAASAMAAAESTSFADLRARITSPGGTTIAGLLALEDAQVRAGWAKGVRATFARSVEMARDK